MKTIREVENNPKRSENNPKLSESGPKQSENDPIQSQNDQKTIWKGSKTVMNPSALIKVQDSLSLIMVIYENPDKKIEKKTFFSFVCLKILEQKPCGVDRIHVSEKRQNLSNP